MHFLAILTFPVLLYRFFKQGRYGKSLLLRSGIAYPQIEKGEQFCIWVHAVSVGETKAVASLVKLIRNTHPDALIVLSSITETGYAEGQKSIPQANHHVYLPFDFSYIVGPIVRRAKPDLVLICETDFWYNFQRIAKSCGAYIALVNGKISERSLERHLTLPWVSQHLFRHIDLFCLQSDLQKMRFERLKISSKKLFATGNLKLDDTYPVMKDSAKREWKQSLGIEEGDKVLVIGSTHYPEEKIICEQVKKVWNRYPHLKVILAPRHPNRCLEVEEVFKRLDISYVLYSKIKERKLEEKMIVIDSIGLLRHCYQIADVAIVAGSYTKKVGGHNILEPAWYGVPVLCGPHMHSQLDFLELFREYGAGIQTQEDGISENLLELFSNEEKRHLMGQGGLKAIQNAKGATLRTWTILSKYCS